MSVRLSISEFGKATSSVVNDSPAPRIDAAWFVDFGQFLGSIDVDVSAVAISDTFTVAPAVLSLWASPSPTSIAGAAALGALSLAATGGLFRGQTVTMTTPNPMGFKYLVLTSQNGSGGGTNALSYRGVRLRLEAHQ